MKILKIFLLFLIPALFAGACASIHKPLQQINCPAPVQSCSGIKWSGMAVDTSASYRQVADYYYVYEPVKDVNSPDDEWNLSFLDPKRAVMTFSDGNEQRVMLLRKIADDKFSVESGLGIPMDGSVGSFSIKEKKVVFASTSPATSTNNFIGTTKIYSAELEGNLLHNVKPISDTTKRAKGLWESQPTMSADGNVVFFASDRNPLNGTDIWFCVRMSDGSWSQPINCGDSINTACDELTPFITIDGKTLLFASSGHDNIGGYDIFSSSISQEFWNAVKNSDIATLQKGGNFFGGARNLRAPLNTPFDELFPSSPGDINDVIYYSSNQAQVNASLISRKGGFDVFVKHKVLSERLANEQRKKMEENLNPELNVNLDIKQKKPDLKFIQTYTLHGTVYNARTRKVVPNADVTVREVKEKSEVDLEREREFESTAQGKDIMFESFKVKADSNGKYTVQLEKDKEFEITAQAKDLFFDSFKVRVDKDDATAVVTRDFDIPEQLTLRINFPTAIFNAPYKYTLDSNGVETNETWQEELDLLAKNLKGSNDIQQLVLTGNTDDVGSESSNKILGQNRVDFVISELIRMGIPAELLLGKSAGKLDPLPERPDENLLMYRKRLRRVELQKILKQD